MTEQNLIFLDVETTGHYSLRKVWGSGRGQEPRWFLRQNHEIIEIGAGIVNPVTREILTEGTFDIKIEPSQYAIDNVDPVAEKINHFLARRAKGEWEDAVNLQVAMRELLNFSRPFGKLVLGNQNFFFDWRFISVAVVVADITEKEWDEHFHYGMFDTRSMAIQELWQPGTPFNPSDYSVRQNQLCAALNIPPEPMPHTALNGVLTAIQVWKVITERKMNRISAS